MTGWWGTFGFSWIGLVFMLSLEVPNILWARRQPAGYDPSGEPRALRLIERVGQVLCTATVLLLRPPPLTGSPWPWAWWLIAAIVLMLIYEGFWVRYFTGGHTLSDFYRPLLSVPMPGATLPVAAFFLLGIYNRAWPLMLAAVILGIGHIGIHRIHARRLATN